MTGRNTDSPDQYSHSEGGSVPQAKRTHPDDARSANPGTGTRGPRPGKSRGNPSMARAIYVLYFVGIIFNFAALIGFVLALSYRKEAQETWVASHYQFQIRTFWIGLGMILGAFTALAYGGDSLVLMGMFLWLIWVLTRTIKGWKLLAQSAPIPDPKTLLW